MKECVSKSAKAEDGPPLPPPHDLLLNLTLTITRPGEGLKAEERSGEHGQRTPSLIHNFNREAFTEETSPTMSSSRGAGLYLTLLLALLCDASEGKLTLNASF